MDWLTDPQIWASLLTLTALEIVLGIDNLVFIAILAGRLPAERQNHARRIGLALALVTRLALLASIAWIVGLTQPLFEIFGHAISWRDLILIGGGLFLLYKGTREIHHRLEDDVEHDKAGPIRASFGSVIAQIVILDIVFSLDSVITAVGMANEFSVMAAAVVIAVLIMLVGSGPVSGFVNRHPTVKMLALSFLLLIGMTLVADGVGFHVPKGYIYAAIAFSAAVETLNQLAARRRRERSPLTRENAIGQRLDAPERQIVKIIGAAGRIMIESISAVTLATKDMRRAVQFYRMLGFELVHGGEDAAFTSFRAGPGFLNLIAQPAERQWSWWGRVIFYEFDVDALYFRLIAAGYRTLTAPRDAEWGERFFHVTDPDGHELSFAWPLPSGRKEPAS